MASKVNSTTPAPASNGGLPKGWRTVRFDELAQMVNERVDPSETDADIYVGLEHLDPDSLTLRRWGTPSDVIGDKLRFRKGDIIFGRRRAYQRKLAVAEFDGICSAHAMVVRANTETVEPEFLPFLMQSDLFMQRAIDISVGSLSPTINWKALRIQEFPLPPKDEQRRIADLLWAADESCERLRDVVGGSQKFSAALISHIWKEGINCKSYQETAIGRVPSTWKVAPLGNFTLESAYGPRFSANEYSQDGNVQTVRTTDFDRRGGLILDTAPFANLPEDVIAKHRLLPGDFLLSRTGEYAGLTATFKESGGCYVAAAFLIRFHLDPTQLLSEYLVHLCYSDFGERFVLRLTTGSAQPNINGSDMLALRIPVPPLEVQRHIVRMGDQARAFEDAASSNLIRCRQLAQAIMNDLFRSGVRNCLD